MENGEIDLIDLYGAFKKTATYRVLNNSLKLITNNKLLFIAFIIVGVSVGYYLQTKKAPVYKSELLIDSAEIDNFVSKNIISGLNKLFSEQNLTTLNKNGFSNGTTQSIISIECVPSQVKIKNEDQNIFKLAVNTLKTDSLIQLESALINYLNNNKYSAHLKQESLTQYNTEILELTAAINELDSARKFIQNHSNSTQTAIHTSLASISHEKLEAKVRIIELNNLINNIDNYEILNGFTPTNTPEPAKGKYPLKFGLLAFILGFLILRVFKK
ncbi:MAG: hypothetical protein P8Q14_06730 [Vicingaceae bacterium]|nr:hypothetical protein [Vicingaceae bacterium]